MSTAKNNSSSTGNVTIPSAADLLRKMGYVRPILRDELFTWVLLSLAVYLVLALSIFEWKSNRVGKKKSKNHQSSAKKLENFLSRGSLCLLAAVFALARCLFQQLELRLGDKSELVCTIYQHQLVEVYHTSLTCLYLLLWARQLKMYKHKALRHLGSPLLRFVSVVVIVGIMASQCATATTYLITFDLITSPFGCVYDLAAITDPESSKLVGLLLFATSFVFQFTLLGLLSYPLVKHYRIGVCCSPEQNEKSTSHNVRRTIIRLSICTTACVLSDMVASCLLMFLHDGITPIMFWADVYSANLLFNILFVTLSFTDWKRRLWPCTSLTYNEVASSSNAASSSGV